MNTETRLGFSVDEDVAAVVGVKPGRRRRRMESHGEELQRGEEEDHDERRLERNHHQQQQQQSMEQGHHHIIHLRSRISIEMEVLPPPLYEVDAREQLLVQIRGDGWSLDVDSGE